MTKFAHELVQAAAEYGLADQRLVQEIRFLSLRDAHPDREMVAACN